MHSVRKMSCTMRGKGHTKCEEKSDAQCEEKSGAQCEEKVMHSEGKSEEKVVHNAGKRVIHSARKRDGKI